MLDDRQLRRRAADGHRRDRHHAQRLHRHTDGGNLWRAKLRIARAGRVCPGDGALSYRVLHSLHQRLECDPVWRTHHGRMDVGRIDRFRVARDRPAHRAGAKTMIEQNPITGDSRILAPERDQRPNAYRDGIDRCPFCPGHESDTPPEIWRDGDPWRVRVFPNKYPATERHEVIVETPNHQASFGQLPPDHAAAAVNTYISRYHTGRDAYVCI